MSDEIETKLLEEVLKINVAVAAIAPQLDRLETVTANINSRLSAVSETAEQHETRIKGLETCVAKIDKERQAHAGWRTRLGGVYVGVTATIGLLAGMFALLQYLK